MCLDETEDGGETVVESISGSTVSPSNSSFNEFCKLDFDAGDGTESGFFQQSKVTN